MKAAPHVMTYIAQKGVLKNACLGMDAYASVSAISWWKNGARLGFPDVSVSYAAPLESAVGSSAGLERQFSTLGSTYGSLRAQLGGEKGWTAGISLQRTEEIISCSIFFLLLLYYNEIFCNKTKKRSA